MWCNRRRLSVRTFGSQPAAAAAVYQQCLEIDHAVFPILNRPTGPTTTKGWRQAHAMPTFSSFDRPAQGTSPDPHVRCGSVVCGTGAVRLLSDAAYGGHAQTHRHDERCIRELPSLPVLGLSLASTGPPPQRAGARLAYCGVRCRVGRCGRSRCCRSGSRVWVVDPVHPEPRRDDPQLPDWRVLHGRHRHRVHRRGLQPGQSAVRSAGGGVD